MRGQMPIAHNLYLLLFPQLVVLAISKPPVVVESLQSSDLCVMFSGQLHGFSCFGSRS